MKMTTSLKLRQDINSELNEKYDLYRTTLEGHRIADILLKLDSEFSPWVHLDIIQRVKKQILVQICDSAFICEESEEQPSPLDPQ